MQPSHHFLKNCLPAFNFLTLPLVKRRCCSSEPRLTLWIRNSLWKSRKIKQKELEPFNNLVEHTTIFLACLSFNKSFWNLVLLSFQLNNSLLWESPPIVIGSLVASLVTSDSSLPSCGNHKYLQFSSAQFSHSVMSDSLWPHESQHSRPPCPSPTPGVYSNSCLSSRWCHPPISSSVIPFSSCPQSLPASGSFPMSQLFA